ncbi:MAG TPA: hypothetical protein VGM39_26535 [Kofleriaceae bacterium]
MSDRARFIAAAIVSIAVVVIVAEPIIRKPYEDGFPLSPYPMFATKRPTKLTMDYPIGITAKNERVFLKPRIIGSGEVLQALQIVSKARSMGTLPQLCETLAKRIAPLAKYKDVIQVEMVTGTADAVEYLVRHVPAKEVVRAQCVVQRGTP